MAVDQETVHQQVVYYLTLGLASPGIILNLLTVVVLFKVKYHLIGAHLILLRSLAFADLTVCILALVKTTSKTHLPQDASWSTCLFDALFEQCSFAYTATFLTLILIAVNQYIAITEALRYNQLVTGRRLRAAVALVWIASLLIHCIDLVRALIISQLSDEDENYSREDDYSGSYDYSGEDDQYDSYKNIDTFCNILKEFKTWEKVAIPWKVFVALVGVGFVALSVIYIKIFIVARSSLKQSEAFSPDVNQQRKTKRHSLYTSLLLLGTFLIVYVPYCTVYATQEVYQTRLSTNREFHEEAVATAKKQFAEFLDWETKRVEEKMKSMEENVKRLEEFVKLLEELMKTWEEDPEYREMWLQLCHEDLEQYKHDSSYEYYKVYCSLAEAVDHQVQATEMLETVEAQLRLITSYMEPILLINAICDPLIYMVKMTAIRKVYNHMMCHFCKKTSTDIQ